LATTQRMVDRLGKSIEQIENYINARLVSECLMLDLPRVQ
jgi:hypothetical protein